MTFPIKKRIITGLFNDTKTGALNTKIVGEIFWQN